MNIHDIELPPLPTINVMGKKQPQIWFTASEVDELRRAAIVAYQQGGNAKQRYDEIMKDDTEEPDPIEDLRFFCSMAMRQQDWLDVEPFFDALIAALQSQYETQLQVWRSTDSCGEFWSWDEADQYDYDRAKPEDRRVIQIIKEG